MSLIKLKSFKTILVAFIIFFITGYFTRLYALPESTRITDIRFFQSTNEAQIIIDLTLPPEVTAVTKYKDGNLRFTIKKCIFRLNHEQYKLNHPLLEVLDVKETEESDVEVTFKTPAGVRAKTYILPHTDKKNDRIVIFLLESSAEEEQRQMAEEREVNKLKSENIKIVVLDAGHGGDDPGTKCNGIVEKSYALKMAQQIKAYFDRDKRFKAILTRDKDYIIKLEERRKIAERIGADAFVSLHVNFNYNKTIHGIEVYYESHKGAAGEAERIVADQENHDEFADATSNNNSSNPVINTKKLIEMQEAVMYKSSILAQKTEARLSNAVESLISRGVKRAGFKVLHSINIPSILVEFGYISNKNDNEALKNEQNRSKLAYSVYAGIADFLTTKISDGKDDEYKSYRIAEEKRKKAEAIKKAKAAELAKKKAAEKKAAEKKAKATTYTVKAGDTLSKISRKQNVLLSSLLKANSLKEDSIIQVGQTLKIPVK